MRGERTPSEWRWETFTVTPTQWFYIRVTQLFTENCRAIVHSSKKKKESDGRSSPNTALQHSLWKIQPSMKKQKFPSWVMKSNKRKKLRHARRTVWKQEYPWRLNTGRWKDIRREKQAWVNNGLSRNRTQGEQWRLKCWSAVGHPVLPDMKHLPLTLLWFQFITGASSLCTCWLRRAVEVVRSVTARSTKQACSRWALPPRWFSAAGPRMPPWPSSLLLRQSREQNWSAGRGL